MATLHRAKTAAGERMILIYHGNTPAIIKAMPRATVGRENAMIFTLGYGETLASFERQRAPAEHRTATYLAERTTLPRPIGLDSQFVNHFIPDTDVSKFGRHLLGGALVSVLRVDVRAGLEELREATLVPNERRPVQRGAAFTIHGVRVRAQLKEDPRRDAVALIHGPMQRRVS